MGENSKFEQENNAADIRETRRLEQQKSIDEIGDFRNIKYEKEQERVDTLRRKKPKSKISESESLLQRDIERENIDTKIINDDADKNIIKCNELTMGQETAETKNRVIQENGKF